MLHPIASHQLLNQSDSRLSSSPKLAANLFGISLYVAKYLSVLGDLAVHSCFASNDSHLAGLLPPFIIALSNRIDKLVKTRLARGGSDLTKDVPDETVTTLRCI